MKKTWIVSYPRSGNTWLRYVIEFLTNRPTNGICGPVNKADRLQPPIILKERTDFIAHKTHNFDDVKEGDSVILCLRDYKECIIRHNSQIRGMGLRVMHDNTSGGGMDYIGLLERYRAFDGKKFLFRYEKRYDVRMHILQVMYQMFYCSDVDGLKSFLKDIELHKTASTLKYPQPQSGGADHFHKNRLTETEQREWDESIRTRHPEIYEAYLTQYEYGN